MFTPTNFLPVVIALSTAFGVLVHDTQIDNLAVAAAIPAVVAGYGAVEAGLKLSDPHLHTERASAGLHSSQPRVQTRGNEDRKHIWQKRFGTSTFDSDYSWPSV